MALTNQQWKRLAYSKGRYYIWDLIEKGQVSREVYGLISNFFQHDKCGLHGKEASDAEVIILLTPILRKKASELYNDFTKSLDSIEMALDVQDFTKLREGRDKLKKSIADIYTLGRTAAHIPLEELRKQPFFRERLRGT